MEIGHDIRIERTFSTDISFCCLDILAVAHHHGYILKCHTRYVKVGCKRATCRVRADKLPFLSSHILSCLYDVADGVDTYALADTSQYLVVGIKASFVLAYVSKERSQMVAFVNRNMHHNARSFLRHIRQHVCLDVTITDG